MLPVELPFHIAKFGGTSVGTPERVQRVVELVLETPSDKYRRVVVTSAFGGVTDRLLAAIDAAVSRSGEHSAILKEIRERHAEAVSALVRENERQSITQALTEIFDETAELLQGVFLLRECTARFQDAIISAGERASAPIVAAAFRMAGHQSVSIDATEIIRTDDSFGEAAVNFAETQRLVQASFSALSPEVIPVVTGFIASTEEGVTTTLGRSGSDYTATLVAAALDAAEVVIWTDVDGVLSADPRLVPEAFTLPQLSYGEAGELAHFGAKVLHPRTMRPLQRAGLPLVIRNTLNATAPGTRIGLERKAVEGNVQAITAARGLALVLIRGTGTLPVAVLTSRALNALAPAGVEIVLMAQASSEGSFCIAVREVDIDRSVRLLSTAFEVEIERGDILEIEKERNVAVVAVVGDFLDQAPGLAGRLFATLGRAHVNVRAIAHGATSHTLSAVVNDDAAVRAVQALHESFALRRLRAHVALIGYGALGQRVADLLEQRADALRSGGLNLRLVGVADSRRLLWDESGIEKSGLSGALNDAPETSLDEMVRRLTSAQLERLIVIDATPSEDVGHRHRELLEAGVAVVTPNKSATLISAADWQAAKQAAHRSEVPYLYETTVGAGLHIVATLRDLIRTGDTIHRVEGVLSGTLAFVLNAVRDGAAFSDAVLEARARALAEPDPRDDLSGRDVVRKLVVLARELGLATEATDAEVESLVPVPLRGVPVEDFFAGLPDFNAHWAERISKAGDGQLQYVCRLDTVGRISAGVEVVPNGSVLADLRGPEIAVAFYTARYAPQPLVLRGPGASADITAAVILADVVRAAEAMR
ncbi:bifunctional aspartate kinase/homoserine dehydrogenase I [soil metagenome]